MDVSVSTSTGHYDWCRPRETQRLVSIRANNIRLNLMMEEDYEFDPQEPWNQSVPIVLKDWLRKTLWSSNLDNAEQLLAWAESEEGDNALYDAWKAQRVAELVRRRDVIVRELTQLGVV